eukprot:3347744-Amphidinium_carterae.1
MNCRRACSMFCNKTIVDYSGMWQVHLPLQLYQSEGVAPLPLRPRSQLILQQSCNAMAHETCLLLPLGNHRLIPRLHGSVLRQW